MSSPSGRAEGIGEVDGAVAFAGELEFAGIDHPAGFGRSARFLEIPDPRQETRVNLNPAVEVAESGNFSMKPIRCPGVVTPGSRNAILPRSWR